MAQKNPHKPKDNLLSSLPTMARRQEPSLKRGCFTLLNPMPQDDAQLQHMMNSPEVVKMIAGSEIEKGGLQHYQGDIETNGPLGRNQVRQLLGRPVHVEPAQGSREGNFAYCSKGGTSDL
jgi:hypothetical protein